MKLLARPAVVSVSRDEEHRFSKPTFDSITLVEGLGVEGDVHLGRTVQHRSRVAVDPSQPNLRQVHLIQSELFAETADQGYELHPGDLGENVTTAGLDLLGLPNGAILRIGATASVKITGLRNPCAQINTFQAGLLKTMIGRDDAGNVVRKAGVMGVVVRSGTIRVGDSIAVTLPAGPHVPLEKV
ncbi:MAG: MOSC domain-containing protein [Glaciihabitans sp.]